MPSVARLRAALAAKAAYARAADDERKAQRQLAAPEEFEVLAAVMRACMGCKGGGAL